MGNVIQGDFGSRVVPHEHSPHRRIETESVIKQKFEIWLTGSIQWKKIKQFRMHFTPAEISATANKINAYNTHVGTNSGLMSELELRPATQAHALWLLAAVQVLKERLGIN